MTAVAPSERAAPVAHGARRGTALLLWLVALVLATRRLEAGLLGELWGYLRPGGERPVWDAPAAARS